MKSNDFLDKNVYFFYPSRVLGGCETLFIRLANYLSSISNKKIGYIDYYDGISSNYLKNVIRVDYNNNEDCIKLPENTVVVSVASLPFSLPKFIGNNIYYLFYNVHIHNIIWAQSIYNITNARLKSFWKVALINHGLISMDETTNWTIRKKVKRTSELCPVLLHKKDVKVKKNLLNAGTINIAILSRLDEDKIYSVINLLENLKKYKTKNKIVVHIIGDGISRNKIVTNNYNFEIKMVGTINNNYLPLYLSENIDILFGMGQSILEGERLGIPSIFTYLYFENMNNDCFIPAFELDGYVLEISIHDKTYSHKNMNINDILNEFELNISEFSAKALDHFIKKFSIENNINIFTSKVNKSTFDSITYEKAKNKCFKTSLYKRIMNLFNIKNKVLKYK